MRKDCEIKTKDKKIVFEEKRSKLTILNNNELDTIKVIVDGCKIKEGLRCDYLFLANNKEYFIELKGQDINHAVKQLNDTILKLSQNSMKSEKFSFIICTRSPISSTSIQNLQIKFKKNFNSKLIVKSSPYEYTI